jgi:ParB family transcriptional regulator, chromosome partitioning protein
VVERGIGRGLAAILPDVSGTEETLLQLPLDLVAPNPDQPRRSFGTAELEELAGSIRAHGVLQPVLVRPLAGGRYELLAGERRLRAARLADLERIPAVVRSAPEGERLELAMIENMARQDLNPVEAAHACAALVEEFGLTKEEVGRRVGRSRVAISNLVRLLELPDEVLSMLEAGELSEGHGRAVLQAPDHNARRRIAKEVRERSLSVRQTEALARGTATERPVRRRKARLHSADAIDAAREAEEALTTALGAEVRVRLGRRGGTVEIPFEELSEVRALARRIGRDQAA